MQIADAEVWKVEGPAHRETESLSRWAQGWYGIVWVKLFEMSMGEGGVEIKTLKEGINFEKNLNCQGESTM